MVWECLRHLLHVLPYDGWCIARERTDQERRIRQLITEFRWRRFSSSSRLFLVPAVRALWLVYCPIIAFGTAFKDGRSAPVARWWRATLTGWLYGCHPRWSFGIVAQWADAPHLHVGNLDDGHLLRLWVALSRKKDRLIAIDKRVLSERLRLLGIAVPRTLLEIPRGSAVDLRSMPWTQARSLLVKPRCGSQAKGVMSIERLDDARFLVNGSKLVSNSTLTQTLAELIQGDSLLVQPFLQPPAETLRWSNNAPVELRLTTAHVPGQEWIVVGCNMKIQPPGEHTATGITGALVVPVDPKSGELESAFFLDQPGSCHDSVPWNGNRLKGCFVPKYHEAVTMVLMASRVLPGLIAIGWDVVIASDGPVVLEANSNLSWRMIHFWHAATNAPSTLLSLLQSMLANNQFGEVAGRG